MSHTFYLLNIPFKCTYKFRLLILHSHSTPSSYYPRHASLFLHSPSLSSLMIPELERPRVTEIQVRMDCNGCVQKIKKALNGINGIYDFSIDFPQKKITIIGWADLEKIVKAIKKTRKNATICVHTEPTEPADQPTEQAPEGGAPPPEATSPPNGQAQPAEAAPTAEPPKDPPPPENPPPEELPAPVATTETEAGQPADTSRPKDVEEIHVTYHHPPDHSYTYGYGHTYGGHWNNYQNGQVFRNEPPPPVYHNVQVLRNEPPPHVYHSGQVFQNEPPPPVYVTHSYNTYRPSPYVTEYEYIRSPPRHTHYSRMDRQDRYSDDHHNSNNSNGNITSMFSDENPNACRIV